MNNADLTKLNTKALRDLRERIDAMIITKQAEAKLDLRKQFAAMAAEAGVSLSDVVDLRTSAKKAPAVPKWRDKTTGVLWSGRGRHPFKFDKKRAEPIP